MQLPHITICIYKVVTSIVVGLCMLCMCIYGVHFHVYYCFITYSQCIHAYNIPYCLKLRPILYKSRIFISGLGIAHYNIIKHIVQHFMCHQLPLEFIASITDYKQHVFLSIIKMSVLFSSLVKNCWKEINAWAVIRGNMV